ncbi:glycosyltransferase [Mitsuokella jalaludinii]|uniref:glycosyltransferase n=1 Tax=Mitsuokella jalaludinii TaxID=187979 RepID=UPI00241FFB82|nr:glycosyltransferase [Mitsuokella jalaludinii]
MGNMNKNKLLSVIVPMYNVEKYLKTCVESIETQTYTPIEIILVDDGSKDSTLRVANNLAAQFDNIKIYSQSNQGQGAARNNGLSHANGDLIAFLDSDDFIEPDMMKTLVDMVDNNNLDFAECSYQDVYCEKNKKSHVHFSNVPSDTVLTGRDFFEHHPILSPCNRVYSALFLKGFQFQFTENRFAEDVYDISNIMLHAKRAMRTDQCYYYYRRDNFGSTRNNKELSHKIKLGKDKLFIVFKLNKLREQYEIHGYISHLIIRNILGALCTSNIYKIKEYRNAMILESKKLDIKKIFSKNISLKIIYSMMLIAINKFLLKKD